MASNELGWPQFCHPKLLASMPAPLDMNTKSSLKLAYEVEASEESYEKQRDV
ncbi:MAG: hypothetical protein JRN52_06065 [Nitrososphaerota archaeon]|nr:hypothetical protein [Nitrososphaerota archaeon]